MGHPSKRLALFLCLIVIHQDFIQARSSFNDHITLSSKFRPRRSSQDILEEDRHEFDESIQEIEKRHGISLRSDLGRPLHRGKRFIGLFIFIVSIVVTVAATAVETIYDIAGCCGLGFSYLCGFESNFDKKKADLTRQSELVDQRLENALKKRDDLECLSEVLKALWGSVNKLVKLQEELLGNIDPNFRNLLILRERTMQRQLQNITEELDENEVSSMFIKLPRDQLALKLSLGWTAAAVPGIGLIGNKAYKSYKINKAYKLLKATKLEQVLKSAPKARKLIGFTEGSAKVFLKNTAILKFSNKAGSFLKAMKVFKVAGAVMSVVSIALDLFNIISTFIACAEKRDKAEESCNKLKEAETKVTTTRNNVIEFENILKNGMEAKLMEEVRNSDFQNALTHVKETIECLPDPPNGVDRDFDTAYCIRRIPEFLSRVNGQGLSIEDIKNDMLDIIDNCIDRLKYSYECLKTRLDINSEIATSCKEGLYTFEEIYHQQTNSPLNKKVLDECKVKGEPYTTKPMFKTALDDASKIEGMEFYSENCKMNNPVNQDDICEGNSVDGITSAQQQKVRNEKCENGKAPKIDTKKRGEICIYVKVGYECDEIIEEMEESIPNLTEDDIKGLGCGTLQEADGDE